MSHSGDEVWPGNQQGKRRVTEAAGTKTAKRFWLAAVLLISTIAIIVAALGIPKFRLDASADSLVVENDPAFLFYQEIQQRYGSDNFLIVTYTPNEPLFAAETLQAMAALRDDLRQLPQIAAVTTVLDVPLINSPRLSLSEVQQKSVTLEMPSTDQQMARQELVNSPLYRNLLINQDATTTALIVYPRVDEAARANLQQPDTEHPDEIVAEKKDDRQMIAGLRAVLENHSNAARIHLGGVPMIAVDMMQYVATDLRVFGAAVAVFLLLVLAFSFRRVRWVLIPAIICLATAVVVIGLLGWLDWPITVVSSNFISLLLIITLSLSVHLIVRHRELQAGGLVDRTALVRQTMGSKFAPSAYAALTTSVAFGSLVVSGIRPVIDFGLMMVLGIVCAFVLTFSLFPALLSLFRVESLPKRRFELMASIAAGCGWIVQRLPKPAAAVFLLTALMAGLGLPQLGVENRFIDYFRADTEIYQGMVLLDRELGGTTPLDVVIDAPAEFFVNLAELRQEPWWDEGSTGLSGTSYWFTEQQQAHIANIHQWLDNLPETGKVLSLATTMELITTLNAGEPLDNFALSVAHKRLPDNLRKSLLDPYMAEDGNQLRFSIRVIDSAANLNRQALLENIRDGLQREFNLQPEQLHLSGMLVLYNNVLQSLFKSQILTLVVVFAVIGLMFLLLFRSLRLALIALTPTLFAALVIIGGMGWAGIPLNIMTITIAAITVGIGVDDTIHYMHRWQQELAGGGTMIGAIQRTGRSVGRAIVFTSVTISAGFGILVLSQFMPSVYFGVLTALAMILALLANMILLPILLQRFGQKV